MINVMRDWLNPVLDSIRAMLGRGLYTETYSEGRKLSLFIRHIDGGSDNAAELELAALYNPIYDIEQYGIRFVNSPRHADLLLVTGPLTWSMLGPALTAFKAMPGPKRIVTLGDCAHFGEATDDQYLPFIDSYAVTDLPEEMKAAVIAHIPGNPPNPEMIISVLLSLNLSTKPTPALLEKPS
jgi:Ni,Fe-hydrogenase III small subunit